MKHILVTGGLGFIGSNLVKRLLALKNKVTVIDNLVTGDVGNVDSFLNNGGFSYLRKDICAYFSPRILGQLNTVSEIYHLACPTGVDNLVRLGAEIMLACSAGTKNILDLARRNKAKFLFTSSSEVYGNPGESPQRESYSGNVNPAGERATYEEGKRFSESLVMLYFRKYKLKTRIARLFNTYGFNMSAKDSRVIPSFVRSAIRNENIKVHGKGEQERTFCFVEDLVEGLMVIMREGENGGIYNLGGSEKIKIKDLAKLILFLSKSKSKLEYVTRPKHDHDSRLPDISRMRALCWHPRTTLSAGLKKILP